MAKHHWVKFSKGKIQVTGCSKCGQICMPSNENSECIEVEQEKKMLSQRGFQVVTVAVK